MARITRKFIEARLVTTTTNLRDVGMLAPTESLRFESTGHDGLPWQLVVMSIDPADGARRITASMTTNVTWGGLNTAVDALYEAGWHARSVRDAAKLAPVVEVDPVDARIRAAGETAGRNAAAWWSQHVLGGSSATYGSPQYVLDGIDAGDPLILDGLPVLDLSGEMADGLTADDVLSDAGFDPADVDPDAVDDILDRYRDAFDGAVLEAVEAACAALLSDD